MRYAVMPHRPGFHSAPKVPIQLSLIFPIEDGRMQGAVVSSARAPAVHRPSRALLRPTDGSAVRILVVDRQPLVSEMISMALQCDGAHVVTVRDGASAVASIRCSHFDLAIISSRLRDVGGRRLLSTLRDQLPSMPLLLLTDSRRRPHGDFVAAVDASWLTKPFSTEEVVHRVRLMLRDNGFTLCHDVAQLTVDDLVLDEHCRQVIRGGEVIQLPPRQFDLLRFFMRNEHCVLTKRQILGRVWPYDFAGHPNVVQTYVSYLRKNVDAGRTPLIHTVRRWGYILKSAEVQPDSQYLLMP